MVISYQPSAFSEISEASDGTSHHVNEMQTALKLATKFSIPIIVIMVVGSLTAAACYQYKNPSLKLTGELTREKVNEFFNHVDSMELQERNLTIEIENAVIKAGALHNRTFNHRIVIKGKCTIEKSACKNTAFENDFEIDGKISENSNLRGSRFEKSIIVNSEIPKTLFFGSNVILNKGNVYRLPKKFEISFDGTDISKERVKNYLGEEYFPCNPRNYPPKKS